MMPPNVAYMYIRYSVCRDWK